MSIVADWIPVGERLPEQEVPVLAFGPNSFDKARTMRAVYVRARTHEDDGSFAGDTDYDEAKDTYYWPEGWYEWNEHEETHWRIDFTVTHWMPLPPGPREKE